MSAKLPSTWEAMILDWLAQGMPGPGYEAWAKRYLADQSFNHPPNATVEIGGQKFNVAGTEAFHELFERAEVTRLENENVAQRLAVLASNVQRAHLAYRAASLVHKARAYGYSEDDLREGFRQLVMLHLRGMQHLLRHIGGPAWDRELNEIEQNDDTLL